MVLLEKVRKHYGIGVGLIKAVDDVSLEVKEGEFVVILGPSGSGKTTLLNLTGGMARPDGGRIVLGGQDIVAMKDAGISALRAQSVGFVFQFRSMMPMLNALENVLLPTIFCPVNDAVNLARSLLEEAGLKDRIKAYAHELSMGQQRRVGIARSLINSPKLLLCDEPTGDLDSETESAIIKMITEANARGATVMMATHNRALSRFASRTLVMKDGRIES